MLPNRRRLLLIGMKTLHTLVFVVMVAAILYLLYCGVADQISIWTGVALVTVGVEVIIYVGNRFRCPLRDWAERLSVPGEPISDIYLPAWMAARVVSVSTPLLGVACGLLLVRLLAG